jgi:sugar/nucleoside kinase (ribokinase family)
VSDFPTVPHIAVIGNVNVDMIMGPQEPWPRAGTEVVLPDYELRVGGQAGNAALALQAVGVPMRLITNVGNDILGRWLQESFGESAKTWRIAECPTCISIGMTHPNGERTFFTYAGHLDLFGPDDVLPFLPPRAADGSVALLVAVFLSPPFMAALPKIISALKAANYRIALDTGWPPQGWTDSIVEAYGAWLGDIDTLLINEVEATALAKTDALDEAVARIRKVMRPDATFVIKRGPDGASAWRGDENATAAAPKVVVADSIGAGDVFNVGFLRAELRGASLAEAVKEAVTFASAVIATRPRRYDVS